MQLTATPKAIPSLDDATASAGAADGGATGAAGAPGRESYVADVTLSHSGGITTAKPSTLSLSFVGETAALAKASDSVSLDPASTGAAPRVDIGTRVKASARPRGSGLELDLDLDLEVGALEGTNGSIRKIVVHGPLFAPLDAATTAFAAEEDGQRYVVTLTPHRAP